MGSSSVPATHTPEWNKALLPSLFPPSLLLGESIAKMMRSGAKALQTLAGQPALREGLARLASIGGIRMLTTNLKDVLESKIPAEQVGPA